MNIDRDDVERAFGHGVASYDVEPIDPHLRIHSVTGGVYRVRTDGGSCVVKVVRHGVGSTADGLWGSDEDERARNYWKREWLAFDSGLLDNLPGRLRAPRTLLTTQPADDECWIWMEDVHGRSGSALELDDYDAAAFAAGSTQGVYASGRVPLPTQAWLSRDWLRGWVDVCADSFIPTVRDADAWTDGQLQPMLRLRTRIETLWQAVEELLRITTSAPATLTHWDFWPANLYVDGAGAATDVVAIDWSQVGISGLTHDLDQLTLDPVWMFVRPDESIDVLEQHVLTSYVDGLHTAECDASAADVRRWYAAAAAARYAWLPGGYPRIARDDDAVQSLERRFGRDFASIVATKARVVERAVELGEWALESPA